MHAGTYTGRLAPSPTGLLHLGHARTFAVAHARAAGGVLHLRMDDLDPERSRPEYAAAAERDLLWLGIGWQGPVLRQSERAWAYRAAWQQLVQAGLLYPCSCSRRELRMLASAPHESRPAAAHDEEPLYPGTCRPAAAPSAIRRSAWLTRGPHGANWRFRAPAGQPVRWFDGGQGEQRFVAGKHFGDFAVFRRDGVAAYQLATVVDDIALGITEVVRGADLLLSTARQLLLFDALGARPPRFFHCPLLCDSDGSRLAKRTDALSIAALRENGRSPDDVLAMAAGS